MRRPRSAERGRGARSRGGATARLHAGLRAALDTSPTHHGHPVEELDDDPARIATDLCSGNRLSTPGWVTASGGEPIRVGADVSNRWRGLRGNPFRVYVHRTADVLASACAGGLVPVATHGGRVWQTLILERPEA